MSRLRRQAPPPGPREGRAAVLVSAQAVPRDERPPVCELVARTGDVLGAHDDGAVLGDGRRIVAPAADAVRVRRGGGGGGLRRDPLPAGGDRAPRPPPPEPRW